MRNTRQRTERFFVQQLRHAAIVAVGCVMAAGCSTAVRPPDTPPTEQVGRPTLAASQAQSLQSAVMALADTMMQRISSELDLSRPASSPEERRDEIATRLTLSSALVSIAVEPNPVDALADLLTFATLTADGQRIAAKDKPVDSSDARLLRGLEQNEADAWRLAQRWVNAQTLAAFREHILAWPGQRPSAASVAFVRLSDLKRAGSATVDSGDGMLDSLQAATKQIDETRMLAERSLYLAQRFPFLMRWQAEVYTSRALATKESQKAQAQLEQMTVVMAATSRMLEGMADQFSKERQTALEDLFGRVANERKATLEQVMDMVQKERHATLVEASAAIDAQRAAILKDLASLADHAGRTGEAWIGRSLLLGGILIVLFLAGLLGVMLLFRRLAPTVQRR